MSTTKSNKLFRKLTLISAMAILTFSVSGGLLAQEETPTVEPTSVPTEIPTEVPPTTEPPTLEPTVEPTSVPTEMPTEVPPPTTETSPTVEPTQEATAVFTEVPTETPTIISAPPVFNFTSGTVFENVAGTPLTFQISVSDETGLVAVMADTTTSTGSVSFITTAPVETAPPFNTIVDVTYTAPMDFSGVDTFTLTATDAASVVTAAAITVNVALPEPTVEATETVVPTDIPVPTRELIINYSPAASEESIQAMLAALSAVEISRIPQIGAMRVLVPETVSQPAVAMSMLQSSRVAYAAGVTNIEPNGTYQLLFTPNDPQFGSQWGLGNTTGGIYASYAWDASTRRGTGITVAVLDSGVDFQHPDLAGQLTTTGWDFVNNDSNADDDNGHGTQVAGIIAARTNNLVGIAGIAYLAKIMPVKVCDAAATCELYHIAGGIIHAVDRGARIINLSLGSRDPSSTMEAAIHYALSRNVVVVAAAGNYGLEPADPPYPANPPIYPAYYPGVISVGMHDSTGLIDPMSTNNNQVDFSAPGVNIVSTVPIELDPDGAPTDPDDGYTTDTGTSFAAPHVSGVAALLMSASVATTPATVMDALRCGAEDAGAAGYDNLYGHGRVKADFAMTWNGNSASCTVTLPNDNFEAASVITVAPYRATQAVHSRSITEQASDPQICGSARQETLWYRYRPTVAGFYQISTHGSSYDTVFGVFQGSAGALSQVDCSLTPQKPVALDALVTYYIVVAKEADPIDNQVLELRVNPVISRNNLDYQENSTSIAYTGSWARGVVSGASGSYTQQTYDQQATASFSFRGMSFDYVRTVGPAQGQAFIYVNGVLVETVNNRAAVTRSNQVENVAIPAAVPGQWNVVRIMRDPLVAGSIDIDRIRTYDFDSTALAGTVISRVDDRHSYLRYIDPNTNDSWDNVGPPSPITGTYLGTLKETLDDTDYMVFRGRGNAITIYRATGTNYADMEVVIDNGTPIVLANVAGTPTIRSFTIDGLANTEHVVEIRKQAGDSGQIQLDSVQASVLGTLAAGVTYQERVAQLAYRGTWTDTTTTTRTLDANSEVSFKFSGNDLCIGYQRPNSALQIYFDGTLFHTLPAELVLTGPATWCVDATNGQLLADITHYARLVPSGGTFTLDYFKPQRYSTITPARGIVQENNASFRYSAVSAWTTSTSAVGSVVGGSKPQGGYLRWTTTDDTTITFYINGTGFILYTGVGPQRGCWEMTVDGGAPSSIDLWDPRNSPLGYGITGLNPGIHRIVLVADTDLSSCAAPSSTFIVDFDAVRVFP